MQILLGHTMLGLSCTIAAGLTFKSLSFWFDHILLRGLYLDMLQVLTIPAVQNRRIYSWPTYDQWAVQKGRHFYNLARWSWSSSLVAEWLRAFMDGSDDTYGSEKQIGISFVGCVCCVMMWVGHQGSWASVSQVVSPLAMVEGHPWPQQEEAGTCLEVQKLSWISQWKVEWLKPHGSMWIMNYTNPRLRSEGLHEVFRFSCTFWPACTRLEWMIQVFTDIRWDFQSKGQICSNESSFCVSIYDRYIV